MMSATQRILTDSKKSNLSSEAISTTKDLWKMIEKGVDISEIESII